MGELDLWTSEALPDARAVIGAGWFLVKTRISCIGYNETGVEGGSRKNNFGVWCLVFGVWCLVWSVLGLVCISICDGDAESPFRPYGGSLLVVAKSNQKPCAPPSGPTLRFGSLRAGAFRARAAYDLLRKSTSRAFGCAEGCCAPGPPGASAQPPEVANRRRLNLRAGRSRAGESLRSRRSKAKAKAKF
jgi:hypothetical protein